MRDGWAEECRVPGADLNGGLGIGNAEFAEERGGSGAEGFASR